MSLDSAVETAYLIAALLFLGALAGLSRHDTAKRGNLLGIAGMTLAFARALGDFGATLMVAGDTPHLTQTMPLAVYDAVLTDNTPVVRTFVLLSALLCLAVCVLAARLGRE